MKHLVLVLIVALGHGLFAAQLDTTAGRQALAGAVPEIHRAYDLPVSLERIKRKLAEAPPSDAPGLRLRYYVEVYGKAPPRDFLSNFDVQNGPVPHGAPTHGEFLREVTPQEFRTPALNLLALINWLARGGKDR